MTTRTALILVGTRPEAIKLAPVIMRLRQSRRIQPLVCATGQHKEMLKSALGEFGIRPDLKLAVMRPGQTLNALAGKLLLKLDPILERTAPVCLLVQGDTSTALAGALSAFYRNIPVGHVEAGLRSWDMRAPYPEEFNRRAVTLAAAWHFAPTRGAADNLLREGVNPERIHITGNTVVDALQYMRGLIRRNPPPLPIALERRLRSGQPFVLVTGHRRENFGQGMEDLCSAIRALSCTHPECAFVYPVHLNPQVRDVVCSRLAGRGNVLLIEPLPYRPFLRLLDACLFVMSDSGGIQEEAPSFGKRVLVMRAVTERPEGVAAGFCQLVGTDPAAIIAAAEELFASKTRRGKSDNPYGDGRAAERIVEILENIPAFVS